MKDVDIVIKNLRTIDLTKALAGCAAGEAEITFPGGKYIWQGFGPMKFRASEDVPKKPRRTYSPRKPKAAALGNVPPLMAEQPPPGVVRPEKPARKAKGVSVSNAPLRSRPTSISCPG